MGGGGRGGGGGVDTGGSRVGTSGESGSVKPTNDNRGLLSYHVIYIYCGLPQNTQL